MCMPVPVSRKAGFTLIEMMIVALVIGIILSIALPNWMKARETSRTQACISNLTAIENAKDQCAMEYGLGNGYVVVWADLVPAYIRSQPQCPSGGDYVIGPIGIRTDCPIANHDLP